MTRFYPIFLVFLTILSISIIGIFFANPEAETVIDRIINDSYRSGGDGHIATAINILVNGRFDPDEGQIFGIVLRGPVYSLLLAFLFIIFGVQISVAWFLNGFFFVAAVLILFFIARYFLNINWAFVVAALLALFWGAAIQVWSINTEAMTLFFTTALIFVGIKYYPNHKLFFLILQMTILGLLVLTKPIFYYFMPVVVLLNLLSFLGKNTMRHLFLHMFTSVFVLIVIVGGWRMHNAFVLGSSSLGHGGNVFFLRAQGGAYTGETLKGFVLSSLLGNYIADNLVFGYAKKPEPLTSITNMKREWEEARIENVLSANKIDSLFWEKGKKLFYENPVQFFAVAPAYFLRLNSPVRYVGGDIDNLFVETYSFVSAGWKIFVIFTIRFMWYMFVGVVCAAFFRCLKACYKMQFNIPLISVVLLVAYTNVIYSLATHAEVRYLLPVMPFYFLLFIVYFKGKTIHA